MLKARQQAEVKRLREMADRYRRRHHYMCRNRDGDYSVQDLMLVLFAADVADRLADHTEVTIKVVTKMKSWKHEFMRLDWYENAQRDDITEGQAQDFKNLISAF